MLETLPTELIFDILRHLEDLTTVLRVAQVNKQFNELATYFLDNQNMLLQFKDDNVVAKAVQHDRVDWLNRFKIEKQLLTSFEWMIYKINNSFPQISAKIVELLCKKEVEYVVNLSKFYNIRYIHIDHILDDSIKSKVYELIEGTRYQKYKDSIGVHICAVAHVLWESPEYTRTFKKQLKVSKTDNAVYSEQMMWADIFDYKGLFIYELTA